MKMKETITFAAGECFIGLMLAAFTQKGVCAVFFGDDLKALKEELRRRFPRADLVEGDGKIVKDLISWVEHPGHKWDLPLDERGTPFQLQVWRELRKVPVGKTETYAEIARRMGRPTAVRAVGTACGANPISFFTPCHRIISSSGGLSGYFWGISRKQQLLKLEKQAASGVC